MLIEHDFSIDDEEPRGRPEVGPRPANAPGLGPDPLARKVDGFLEARRLKVEGHLRPKGRARPGSIPTEQAPDGPGHFANPAGPPAPAADLGQGGPEPEPEPVAGPTEADPTPPSGRPTVVIERAESGLLRALFPPVLILAAAGVILAFRVREPDWEGIGPHTSTPATGAIRSAPPGQSSPVAAPGPVVARVKEADVPARPEPPPADPPAGGPAEVASKSEPIPEAVVPAPPTALAPIEPPPLAAELAPFADPAPPEEPVAKEDALRDIHREARQKAADREEAEDLKVRAAARERAESRRRQAAQVRRSEHFVDEDRPAFRDELRRLVRMGGPRAGVAIHDLCEQHKLTMPPATEKAFKQARLTVGAKLGRRTRVELYRKLGVPEPLILYELANDERVNVGRSKALQGRMDVLVLGARHLLEIPLPEPGPVADAGMPPGDPPANRPR